jgi:hypothetical protein
LELRFTISGYDYTRLDLWHAMTHALVNMGHTIRDAERMAENEAQAVFRHCTAASQRGVPASDFEITWNFGHLIPGRL